LIAIAVAGLTPASFGVTKINNNQAVALNAAEGTKLRYKFWVPKTKNQIVIKIFGGTGDADLFVRRDTQPTSNNWDFRPVLNGNNEQVTINNPTPSTGGTWYHIMVDAFETIANVTLVAQFQNNPSLADNGGLLKSLADIEDNYRHAHIDVPPGATKLIIKTSGGSGDMDLYVNFSIPADEDRWDYRPFRVGNNESVVVNNPAAGTWWVMMHAYTSYASVKLTAEFEGLPKYRANRQGSSDTSNDANFTNSPATSWRYDGHLLGRSKPQITINGRQAPHGRRSERDSKGFCFAPLRICVNTGGRNF
jgi:serine protease